MCQKGDGTAVTTLRPIFLLVEDFNRGILPFLRHAPSPPHSSGDFIEARQIVRISFVDQDVQEFNREAIRPDRLAVRRRPDRFFHLILRRDVVQQTARGSDLELVGDGWIKDMRLGVLQFLKPPYPTLSDESNVPQ